MNLCLEREGSFRPVGMVETLTRCGPIGSQFYRYHVKIDATDDSLSPEGFIIENGRVHNYFHTRYCTGRRFVAISCERMAAKAAMDIGKKLVREGISVTKVLVTIFGSNNARLTAEWKRENV